ncbi:hypothetical protein HBH92_072990 [Parastagonospora nodorum]|nr:hypothetical protein HBH54_010740 [Parastagonospora nodorum]KAH3966514.1 hypothetical protein HBH52_199760 [Parastagonospora nodorum]KAH4144428.1 hypothetical protein HBH45_031040 [Parastagonospora nodorum]KAH4269491.1 hypothetical protein HBI03_054580 [Parastagonospora nodorum]KAH4280563.1 hypothetical protein HBI04_062230 [Parastagonospora nodorum]
MDRPRRLSTCNVIVSLSTSPEEDPSLLLQSPPPLPNPKVHALSAPTLLGGGICSACRFQSERSSVVVLQE